MIRTLTIILLLVFIVFGMVFSACTKTVYVTPSTAPISVVTPPPTPSPTQAEQTLATVYNIVLSGGYYEYLPTNGAYVQAGKTLTLSWSADGNLEGYIFTENQFKNFKPFLVPSGYEAYSSGKSQTISARITNSDIYYGVVANRIMLAPSKKLYQATLTKR